MAKAAVRTKAKTTRETAKETPAKVLAKPKVEAKKQAAKPKKTKEENLDPVIDFCGVKLTPLRRDFLVNYITPGSPAFHNALQAALKAGYRESTAKAEIYGVLRDPDIQKIIKKNEGMAYQALHESAMRALELKQRRAFFDPADYFEEKEITITNKNGEKYTKSTMGLKALESMTADQRMCIDGIDIKGQHSDPVYLMANREREINDIIKIDRELSGAAKGGGQDVEELKEIIIERVTIRQKRRVIEAVETAEYEIIEPSNADIEEEL